MNMNKKKLKVQLVKKLMIQKKDVKCQWRKRRWQKKCDHIVGDDVDSAEEAKIRSSKDYVNNNDDLVSGLDASSWAGDNVYDFF